MRIRTANNRRRARAERRAWSNAAAIVRNWREGLAIGDLLTRVKARPISDEEAAALAYLIGAVELPDLAPATIAIRITYDPGAGIHSEEISAEQFYRQEKDQ